VGGVGGGGGEERRKEEVEGRGDVRGRGEGEGGEGGGEGGTWLIVARDLRNDSVFPTTFRLGAGCFRGMSTASGCVVPPAPPSSSSSSSPSCPPRRPRTTFLTTLHALTPTSRAFNTAECESMSRSSVKLIVGRPPELCLCGSWLNSPIA
jgi:hypothetical protein